MRKTALLSVALCAVSMGAPALARAAPDITGMWALDQPADHIHQAQPKLTPAAKAEQDAVNKISAANNRLIGEAHTKCWPAGMPGMMQPPFGIEFLQTKGRVTILSEVSTLPRTIYLDEKVHPDSVQPGWNGHSIGHWKGNVLVADTIALNGRLPRTSPKTHITERIFLEDGGKHLVDELVVEDPDVYAEPYHLRYRYKRVESGEGAELMEYVCEVDPANLFAYEREQKEAGRPSDFDPPGRRPPWPSRPRSRRPAAPRPPLRPADRRPPPTDPS
ncbi:hypothetical protein [Phenylobacterium aquaticum]|uniref:hypothetical protein n=1 Tax=Phenylobacterium aquaticum TaxID=1763816 RepID=UPI001F5CD747|nr:hypothetical protein [Phenylobacterium aquaticum]MCI3135185.1 hypothetical protein [Phenylobacterium aquaticum]